MPSLVTLAAAICWTPAGARAQLPQADWQDLFGAFNRAADVANAVDASGNVYVVGNAASDVFVRKYDPAGVVVWSRTFGTVLVDVLQDIAVDASGVIVAGYTAGTFSGNTSAGGIDAVIRKYDHDGNVLWTRQFGTFGTDQLNGVTVVGTDIYAAGTTTRAWPGQVQAGGNDSFVFRCDASGALVWARQFGTAGAEDAQAIEAMGSAIYVAGRTTGALHGTNQGLGDIYLRAYDTAGNLAWGTQLGSTGGEFALCMAVEPSAVYVGGSTSGTMAGQTSSGSVDALVARYSVAGQLQWVRQFGSSGSDDANGLAADANGVYVGGFVATVLPGQVSSGGNDAYARMYDAAGSVVWTSQFGTAGADAVMGLAIGSPGLVACGRTSGSFAGQQGGGSDDAFLRAFDSAGTELWTRQFGYLSGARLDRATAIGVGTDGCTYVGGWTEGFFPNASVSAGSGGRDCYLRKYDPAGNLLWTRQFGSTGQDTLAALVVDESGVLVTGTVGGDLPGQTSSGGDDAFVRKFDLSGEELWTRQFGTSSADGATAIAVHESGFCVAGWTAEAFHGQPSNGGEDAFVCKFDVSGNVVWTRLLGGTGNDCASGLSVYDGNVFLATAPRLSYESGEGFLARYDGNGFVQWTRLTTASGTPEVPERLSGIHANGNGVHACAVGWSGKYQTNNCLIVRRYSLDGLEDWVTEEPITSNYSGNVSTAQTILAVGGRIYVAGGAFGSLRNQPSSEGVDTFVMQLDSNGHPGWTYQVNLGGDDYAASIAYKDDRLFLAGGRNVSNQGFGLSDSYVATLRLGIGVVDSTPPVADAGMDQAIHAGIYVQLDGGASSDDTTPNEALVYDWELVAAPSPNLNVANYYRGPVVDFAPYAAGEFRFRLIVTDEQGNRSQPDEVVISSLNIAPTADAGPDQIVLLGTQALVDTSGSYDPDGDPIWYRTWTIVSAPAGSTALPALWNGWYTYAFQPDLPGTYVLELVVSDPWSDSAPDSLAIVAATPTEFAQIKLQEACAQIHALTPADFDAPGHQHSLCNQLAQIVNFVQMGNIAQAQQHLAAVTSRVDGWTLRYAFDPKGQGQPYAADFVVTEAPQEAIHGLLTEAASLLAQ